MQSLTDRNIVPRGNELIWSQRQLRLRKFRRRASRPLPWGSRVWCAARRSGAQLGLNANPLRFVRQGCCSLLAILLSDKGVSDFWVLEESFCLSRRELRGSFFCPKEELSHRWLRGGPRESWLVNTSRSRPATTKKARDERGAWLANGPSNHGGPCPGVVQSATQVAGWSRGA
eukprot:3911211-Amphidinium_carterae.5